MNKIFCLTLWLVLVRIAGAQTGEETDKTLSPYFLVKSTDPHLEQLPLKSGGVSFSLISHGNTRIAQK